MRGVQRLLCRLVDTTHIIANIIVHNIVEKIVRKWKEMEKRILPLHSRKKQSDDNIHRRIQGKGR